MSSNEAAERLCSLTHLYFDVGTLCEGRRKFWKGTGQSGRGLWKFWKDLLTGANYSGMSI